MVKKATEKKTESVDETSVVPVSGATSVALSDRYEKLMAHDEGARDVNDIMLPKILLMQGQSKQVQEEKAKLGEMRESLDYKILGDRDTSVEIIPFHSTKTWVNFKDVNGKLEYVNEEAWTPANADRKWEEVIDGVKHRHDQSLNWFVLLPSEIAAGEFMPYVVSFRRTSYNAGKKLETAREKKRYFKKPICSSTFQLSCKRVENDKGSFYVFDIHAGRETVPGELDAVAPWLDMVHSGRTRVDDSEYRDESTGASTGVGDKAGEVSESAEY